MPPIVINGAVPALRFRPHSEAWTMVQLGNQVDPEFKIRYGIVQPGEFNQNGRLMVRGQDYSSGWAAVSDVFRVHADVEAKYKKARLKCGDIVMTIVGANTGFVTVVPPEFDGANITQTTARIRITEGSPGFWSQILQSEEGKKLIAINLKGAAQPGLNIRDIEKFKLFVPSHDEQQKIAEFLTAVDEKIAKLKRKKELLEEYKRGMMQKLFSQEIRFKDEDGNDFPDWEVRKGNEVFERISDRNHNSDLPILAITQDLGAVPREMIDYEISVSDASVATYKVVRPGNFIISLRSFQGGIEFSNYHGICSPAYIVLQPVENINEMFYQVYLKSFPYILQLKSKLEGIRDGKMVSFKYFSETKLPFPCLSEQERIGDFFKGLNRKHHSIVSQLDKAQDFKRGLLQKMFV